MSEVDEYCEGLYIGLFSEAATCGAASSSMSGWAHMRLGQKGAWKEAEGTLVRIKNKFSVVRRRGYRGHVGPRHVGMAEN